MQSASFLKFIDAIMGEVNQKHEHLFEFCLLGEQIHFELLKQFRLSPDSELNDWVNVEA